MKKIVLWPWLLAALFFLLGILIYTVLVGYQFSAYICFGLGALVVLYRLLFLFRLRLLRRLLSIFLCMGILAAGITGAVILSAAQGSDEPPCEYLIILGAGVDGNIPSYILQDRLNSAYDYLTANPDVICIASGGQGNGEEITEAYCIFRELTARGIDPDRIWMEDKSTSTRENLEFSLEIIRERTGSTPETLDLLSNEFHLYRACMVAGELGITAHGVPAKTTRFPQFVNYILREIPALWYYAIQ